MHLLVYGPGRLGTAITDAAASARWASSVVRRPGDVARRPAPAADVVVDASRGDAIVENLEHALAAGNRRFVLAATGWDRDAARARDRLLDAGASAVVAPNLSLGAALFLRLAEQAAAWYAAAGTFDPSIVEWHRAGKSDRPSGTATAIARRIVAADPRWAGPDEAAADAGDRPRLEVFGVRAGAAPGTHLVTFDGPGESVELRLTARDRTAYAAGALTAARWLVAEPREPGLHPFDVVVDALLADRPVPVLA
ncbi:MAG TPA: dihydrodipicolinate reductase C-terminal domain-containing protein [Candidatus Limnocylindrales bacterium]